MTQHLPNPTPLSRGHEGSAAELRISLRAGDLTGGLVCRALDGTESINGPTIHAGGDLHHDPERGARRGRRRPLSGT